MKVKKISISLVLALCALTVAVKSVCATKLVDPGFSILNKSKKPIWVAVRNGNRGLFDNRAMKVTSFSTFSKNTLDAYMDANAPTIVSIYDKDPGYVDYQTSIVRAGLKGKQLIDVFPIKMPIRMYRFDQGKTVYVSFDSSKKAALYPQSGTFGKTTKGYPLKNNISADGIKEVLLTKELREVLKRELRIE